MKTPPQASPPLMAAFVRSWGAPLAVDAGRNEESARKNADFDDSVYHRDGEDDDFEDEE